MDPISLLVIAGAYWLAHRFKSQIENTIKKIGSILLRLAMIPIAVLAFYMIAALPVSVAIILGAAIVVVGLRGSIVIAPDRPMIRAEPPPLRRFD